MKINRAALQARIAGALFANAMLATQDKGASAPGAITITRVHERHQGDRERARRQRRVAAARAKVEADYAAANGVTVDELHVFGMQAELLGDDALTGWHMPLPPPSFLAFVEEKRPVG